MRRPGDRPDLGERYLFCDGDVPLLFTENETNTQRIFGVPNRTPVRQGRHQQCVVHGQDGAVNPDQEGTKAAAALPADGPTPASARSSGSGSATSPGSVRRGQRRRDRPVRQPLRRSIPGPARGGRRVLRSRHPAVMDADAANVMRQALAGMLWTKQFYHYDVDKWLEERGSDPFKAIAQAGPRNDHWHHMYNGDVISMPDKWEYPWYAAWDLAFHVLRPDARRPGLRQAAAEADAPRAVHAPERPDPGLRVEFRRRQPARPCLVHHLHLSPGKGAEGRRRQGMAQEHASRSCC